jgi:tetratricopeptide (TPR) repeat protein
MIRKWRNVVIVALVAVAVGGTAILLTLNARSASVGLWVAVITALAGIFVPGWLQRWYGEYEILKTHCYTVRGRLPLVREITDPTVLGVHPGARVGGASVPAYVRREFDNNLRQSLATRGFILLVGASVAGTTRSAFEAVAAEVPDHQLIVPHDYANLDVLMRKATRMPQCVLWLDRIEVFLRPDGLNRKVVTQFLAGDGHHRLIVATVAKHELESRTKDENARRAAYLTTETLELARRRIDVHRRFTQKERDDAALPDDALINDALANAPGSRIAEYIAGAPLLLSRLRGARSDSEHERGAALVTAAVDCRRAGLTRPVPRALIEEIHENYLKNLQAELPDDDLDSAWDWATQRQGAAALLTEPSNQELEPGVPPAVGVPVYLADQAEGRVPDSTFRACLNYADGTEAARIGRNAYDYGRYDVAYDAYNRSVGYRTGFGANAPATLASRDNFARVLRALVKLKEAEDETRAVLRIREDLLVSAETETQAVPDLDELRHYLLINRDNLGRILRARGNLDAAEREHKEVLRIRREVLKLAPDCSDILTSRMYLAQVTSARGKHEDALDEFRRIFKVRTDALGEDDPDVLIVRNYLATELRYVKRFAESEIEQREVIARRSRVLRPDHPDTLMSRHNLGLLFLDSGRFNEAASEFEAVYLLRAKVLGPGHPYTMESHARLAEALQMMDHKRAARA